METRFSRANHFQTITTLQRGLFAGHSGDEALLGLPWPCGGITSPERRKCLLLNEVFFWLRITTRATLDTHITHITHTRAARSVKKDIFKACHMSEATLAQECDGWQIVHGV